MNVISKNKLLKKRTIEDYGFILFFSGIFFLPSTLFVGILLLLPASIIGSFLNKKSFFKDPWNYPFLIFGGFILLSTFLQNFILINRYQSIWDPSSSIIGTGNWIPFIWLFWAFQPYLNSKSKRKTFGLTLISGSLPVLITGLGQYFFNWTGPFETLNGLIVWYQRPIAPPGGLTGLFNHQNYAGSWLNLVWPFCLALFLEKRKNIFRHTVALGFLISVGLSAFLTFSRNAWLGLLVSAPLILGKKSIFIILPIIAILFFLLSPIFLRDLQINIRSLIPDRILLEFAEEGYKGLDATRFEIFSSALNIIKKAPFFGTGAESFTSIFLLEKNFWKGHSHNLFLELSISYGLPAAIIFFTSIFFILIDSAKKIFKNNKLDLSIFDKAIWAALFYFIISQLFDIQYFDGKISIVIWSLLSSLKNIIVESQNKNLVSQLKC